MVMKQQLYSPNQVRDIQRAISSRLGPRDIEAVRKKFDQPPPGHMIPFTKLAITNPDLYHKVSQDAKAKSYSLFGFFPETFKLVYEAVGTNISFEYGTRGPIVIISNAEKKLVVKPLQNSRENEIAEIASGLEVGPKQLESLEGFLTEQFVEGKLFTRMGKERTTPESMHVIGRRTGEILYKLHARDVYYNDTILADDMGRSHLIVPESSSVVLFDYGVSIRLDRHTELSDEDVFNFIWTLPGLNMRLSMNPSTEEINDLISEYRVKVQGYSKEEICSRDVSFVEEGIGFASYRLTLERNAVDAFYTGFRESYNVTSSPN
ncbi:MAG: hypothetical protein ABIG39_05945 [Candidatus Micrarchaeota archaeon]